LFSREVVVYIIFGVLTTIVGFGTYALFLHMGLNVLWSNTLSTALAIVFAYVTNKIWVFRAMDFKVKELVKEFVRFVSSRLFSFGVDTALLVGLVDFLGYDALVSKAATSVVVVVLNYVTSKLLVFRKKR